MGIKKSDVSDVNEVNERASRRLQQFRRAEHDVRTMMISPILPLVARSSASHGGPNRVQTNYPPIDG
jgi:hypothetical protein